MSEELAPQQEKVEETAMYTPEIFDEIEPARTPRWPTNTGPDFEPFNLPPDSLWAHDRVKQKAALTRWSTKKMEAVMLSMDRLQLRIFRELHRRASEGERREASGAVPKHYRDYMSISIPELEAMYDRKFKDMIRLSDQDKDQMSNWMRDPADVPLCSYHQDDHGNYRRATQHLNQCLQDLFHAFGRGELGEAVLLAKVAYNLSICPAPPNIHTYNTLLLGVSRLKTFNVSHNIIQALRHTHVRPNEVTLCAILDHYRASDDADNFLKWLGLMRGKHGGLSLAKPGIKVTPASHGRLIPKQGCQDKIIQLPYATPKVFASVIKGVLQFGGFEAALSVCEGMGRERWGLCMQGFTPLLIDCANRGDWDAGLAVWTQIQTLKVRSPRMYGNVKHAEEKLPLEALAAMARLCSKVGRKEVFEKVWAQAMRQDSRSAEKLLEVIRRQQRAEVLRPAAPAVESVEDRFSADTSTSDKEVWANEARAQSEGDQQASPLETISDAAEPPRPAPQPEQSDDEYPRWHRDPVPNRLAVRTRIRSEHALTREQLHGSMPPSHELGDYEIRERPMSMMA